jgi:hypothetical protein
MMASTGPFTVPTAALLLIMGLVDDSVLSRLRSIAQRQSESEASISPRPGPKQGLASCHLDDSGVCVNQDSWHQAVCTVPAGSDRAFALEPAKRSDWARQDVKKRNRDKELDDTHLQTEHPKRLCKADGESRWPEQSQDVSVYDPMDIEDVDSGSSHCGLIEHNTNTEDAMDMS